MVIAVTGIATAYELHLEPGTYLVTGAGLSTLAGRLLNLESGLYDLLGADLTMALGALLGAYEINLEAGVYTISGADLTPVAGLILPPGEPITPQPPVTGWENTYLHNIGVLGGMMPGAGSPGGTIWQPSTAAAGAFANTYLHAIETLGGMGPVGAGSPGGIQSGRLRHPKRARL